MWIDLWKLKETFALIFYKCTQSSFIIASACLVYFSYNFIKGTNSFGDPYKPVYQTCKLRMMFMSMYHLITCLNQHVVKCKIHYYFCYWTGSNIENAAYFYCNKPVFLVTTDASEPQKCRQIKTPASFLRG